MTRHGKYLAVVIAPLFSMSVHTSTFAAETKLKPLPSVLINEVDCDGNDWIELYNRSSKKVDLSTYRLTDRVPSRASASHLYSFPRGSSVLSKKFKVVQQIGSGRLLPFGVPCTGGETIRLVKVRANGTFLLIDSVTVPAIADGFSYGRKTNASRTWVRTMKTKGTSNRTS